MADISKIKPNGASGTEYNLKDATARAAMIPSGGTQGQVLVKKTGTDYDTEWSNGGGTTVVANPSGTATDDLTKVQIGSTIYDVTDKDAMRGTSIKLISNVASERFYLIWECTDAPVNFTSPIQINGDIGSWNGGAKIDISIILNGLIPKMYGFVESAVNKATIFVTKEGTGTSGTDNVHYRLYIYFTTGLTYAQANINLITPVQPQGTCYPNPSATTTYEGTAVANLSTCPVTNKLVGLSDVNISNPLQGQVLQYDATSGKWVNSSDVHPVPDGRTVTPINDIQTWLNCANIWNKTYTTINEVLADSTTLLALISSYNAVDYMVRSTTWASDVCANSMAMTDIGSNNYCADVLLEDSTWRTAICNSTYFESVLNVKVPTLSNNTNVLYSGYTTQYDRQPYYAFDNNDSTIWAVDSTSSPQYIGYTFTNNVNVCKVEMLRATGAEIKVTLQCSNDNNNWTNCGSVTYSDGVNVHELISNNSSKKKYWRLYLEASNSNFAHKTVQFYGRA